MIKKILFKLSLIYTSFSDNKLSIVFAKSSFLSNFYYWLILPRFTREHRAVLAGKAKYLSKSKTNRGNLYTLIRNVHRLEKGLLMQPRRDVFGLAFIEETVDNYVLLSKVVDYKSNSQMIWAHDVLKEYFSVTSNNRIIDKQKSKFDLTKQIESSELKSLIPYKRLEKDNPKISYEDFYKLTKYRRSVRWFLNKKVPRDLIDKAILAANQSPTACNRQPYQFRVIDDTDLLKKVREVPMGLKGYEHNIPLMIVVVGNLEAYFHERDRHVMYIDASLANMSLILALETLGLSSCCVNWPDIEHLEKRMDSLLNLEKYERPIMCLAIGYPDPKGLVAHSEKRELEIIRKYN